MPVRSSNSSVLVWPKKDEVRAEVRAWADGEVPRHPELVCLGYFGSLARGDWGVGSDVDLVAVVSESALPFERRNLSWRIERLPVPADLLVYTLEEWRRLLSSDSRFATVLRKETVWIFGQCPDPGEGSS